MCTVSVIPLSETGGYRLVTNRDEHRERAEATPPRWRELPGQSIRAIWPTDAAAGGTWVGAGEQGLTLALLNLNLRPDAAKAPPPKAPISRGKVIPHLIGSRGPDDAAESLRGMDLREFLPFRLISIGPGASPERARIIECRWDGGSVGIVQHDGTPICFVSSGLGDRLAEPRLALFEELVVGHGATRAAQDEFHAHRWPDRPQVSVMMTRADARTVSVCRVEARPGTAPGCGWVVRMDYRPVAESLMVSVPGQVKALR